MQVAALVSGGKDGLAALHRSLPEHEVNGLLTMSSPNRDSYMFHTHNTSLVSLQAEAMDLPLLSAKTEGIREEELQDLERLLKKAKENWEVQGVLSGAIRSNYQRSRLSQICQSLGLESIAPLWQIDEQQYMQDIADEFKTMVVAVAAAGLDESWLGRIIDRQTVQDLKEVKEEHGINLAFEGGEAETLVLDASAFDKKIEIKASSNHWDGMRGRLQVKEAQLTSKNN